MSKIASYIFWLECIIELPGDNFMMTNRVGATLILSAVFAVIILVTLVTRQDAQKLTEKEVATPVKKGELTQRQREHSKLYSDLRSNSRKLTDFTGDQADGDVTVTSISEYGSFDFFPDPSLDEYVRNQVCSADVIILGKATAKESQLIPEETYIFTDYTFSIVRVLKDEKSNSVATKKEIVVTRGGGKIKLDGREITLNDNDFKRILIGSNYLLFLKRIPETGAFKTIDGSTLVDDEGKLGTLTNPHKGEFLQGANVNSVKEIIESNVASYKCSN